MIDGGRDLTLPLFAEAWLLWLQLSQRQVGFVNRCLLPLPWPQVKWLLSCQLCGGFVLYQHVHFALVRVPSMVLEQPFGRCNWSKWW